MINNIEELKQDVLQFACLTEMPKRITKKNALWVKAIARLKKIDGSVCYGVLMRKEDLTHRYLYVNGNVSRIQEIEEIYPFVTLNNNYIHTFDNDDVNERIEYLKKNTNYTYEKLSEMDINTLNMLVVQLAMKRQLNEM